MIFRKVREASPLRFCSGRRFVNNCLLRVQLFWVGGSHENDELLCADGQDVGQKAGHKGSRSLERKARLVWPDLAKSVANYVLFWQRCQVTRNFLDSLRQGAAFCSKLEFNSYDVSVVTEETIQR